MAVMYSCTGCSLHKGTGSELVGTEKQARLHSVSTGLQNYVFLGGGVLSPNSHKCVLL